MGLFRFTDEAGYLGFCGVQKCVGTVKDGDQLYAFLEMSDLSMMTHAIVKCS